jgi:hypothetical protein
MQLERRRMNDCKLLRCTLPILQSSFHSPCIIGDNLIADSSIPKKYLGAADIKARKLFVDRLASIYSSKLIAQEINFNFCNTRKIFLFPCQLQFDGGEKKYKKPSEGLADKDAIL